MTINGEFYINDLNDDFYLRQLNAWNYKGKLVRAHVVGLTSEGPFPFTDAQYFELPLSETDERYYDAFSVARSSVESIYPTSADCSLVLVDDLAGYLGRGVGVVMTATFTGVTKTASLSFVDTVVPKFTPLWLVMPLTADPAMAGLRALIASEPQ